MNTTAITTQMDLIPLLAGTTRGEIALSQFGVSADLVEEWRDRAVFEADRWPDEAPPWLPELVERFRSIVDESRFELIWTDLEAEMPVVMVFYGPTEAAMIGVAPTNAEITTLAAGEAADLLTAHVATATEADHDWQLGRWIGATLQERVRSDKGDVTIVAREPERATELSNTPDLGSLVAHLAAGQS